MDRGEQAMGALWDVFRKRMWLDGLTMKERLGAYHPSEIHCVAYLTAHQDANVTQLSEAFNLTKSAVSKLTKKMVGKGLIQRYQRQENQKEIYFRLTETGREINDIHEDIHRQYRQRDRGVFAQTTGDEFDAMLAFARRYNEHLDEEIEKHGDGTGQYGPDKL